MKKLTTKIIVAMTMFAGLAISNSAQADDYLRINREARMVERKANLLMEETVHYRATPQYRHLVSDVNEFVRLSQHITDLVTYNGSIAHIKADVNELDATFHHIEELMDTIEYNASRGIGVKCGNTAHVKRLLNSLEDCVHHMQEDIATIELRAALARRRAVYSTPYGGYGNSCPSAARSTVIRETQYNPGRYGGRVTTTRETTYGYGGGFDRHNHNRGRSNDRHRGHDSGIGFTIGGGSSRIHIRF